MAEPGTFSPSDGKGSPQVNLRPSTPSFLGPLAVARKQLFRKFWNVIPRVFHTEKADFSANYYFSATCYFKSGCGFADGSALMQNKRNISLLRHSLKAVISKT